MKRNGMMRPLNLVENTWHAVRWLVFPLMPLLCVTANAADIQTNNVTLALPAQSVVTNTIAPSINFLPLHDEQSIIDFSDVSGEIDRSATIHFTICHFSDAGDSRSY